MRDETLVTGFVTEGNGSVRHNSVSHVSNPTTHDCFIEVTGLTHIYYRAKPGECRALSGVDLTIKKGEYLAVVGPNGSGKSTLARHFNALLLPSSGKVLVDGLDTNQPEHIWEIRRRVGMVFQNPDNQIISSLVEEDVAFGAENLGLLPAQVRARVAEALEQTGLTGFRLHAPHLLSGGQKQRLAIAGVLAMQPTCLVLDEPTAMLDPAGRRELLNTLERLNRSFGITVVLVTHFMEEAARADRVLVLAAGKTVLMGTPAEVFSQDKILEELGLELPAPTQIARGLKRRGFLIPGASLTPDDLVKAVLDKQIGYEEAGGRFSCFPKGSTRTVPLLPSVIKVENLTHIYAPGTPFQVTSLDNVSLEIYKGEFLAVVGATGSGKSTLVQHFNGLLKPTRGKLVVCGLDVSDKQVSRTLWRKVGLVFQRPEQQFFEETVFDDVAFGPRNMGLGKDEVKERVEEALRLAGLDPLQVGQLSPYRLSGGMKRRAAIAGVLALRPEVLALDEPTAGLDPQGRRQLLDRLENVRREWGVTIILVTHSMEEVGLLAGRVAVLNRGRLSMVGTPREVFSRAEELREMGLDIPIPAAIMTRLQAAGKPVRTDILSNSEAEAEIAKILPETGKQGDGSRASR
ncbi:MAG: energy-coupling factor transporter ATPase [Desulfotomaculaceae bacterium]|nr:energy-coupling factor transporter ATPase [Desulfotomaculaceae bacterium]